MFKIGDRVRLKANARGIEYFVDAYGLNKHKIYTVNIISEHPYISFKELYSNNGTYNHYPELESELFELADIKISPGFNLCECGCFTKNKLCCDCRSK